MWLVYLRFDDGGKAVTMHVDCGNQLQVREVISRAQDHGLTATAKLVEYALFSSRGTIQPRTIAVLHATRSAYVTEKQFRDEWDKIHKNEHR